MSASSTTNIHHHNNPSTTTTTTAASSEWDERLIAKAALDAAEEELRSLCASHAATFVAVERRGGALEAALSKLQATCKRVEPHVLQSQHQLEEEHAATTLQTLSDRHRVRRRTLLQHGALLELLELPSLMDACVRSNLYEEAIAIASFANTLERRHANAAITTTTTTTADTSARTTNTAAETTTTATTTTTTNNVVVEKVVAQIRTRQSDLRRHLLHRLKQDVTMPQCLEVVTALRRLNSIDLERMNRTTITSSSSISSTAVEDSLHQSLEYKLQVDFLEARDVWLQHVRSGGSTTTATAAGKGGGGGTSEQLLDTIERYRTRVFEIATQFNAIFRASSSSGAIHHHHHNKSPAACSSNQLLSMWTTRRVQTFLQMLSSSQHSFTDAAALRDAWEASAFFATSMGRLGADFGALLPPLLEPPLLQLVVQQHWHQEGLTVLQDTLQACRDAGVASPLVSNTALVVVPVGGSDSSPAAAADEAAAGQPPRCLLQLPALARLVNAVLAGLNELRRCLLPGVFGRLRRELRSLLERSSHVLQTHERAVLTPGLRGEAAQLREVAARMRWMLERVVEPYLCGALELALGDVQAAKEYLDRVMVQEEEEEKSEHDEEEHDEEEGQQQQQENDENETAKEEKDPEKDAEPLTATEESAVEEEQAVEPAAVDEPTAPAQQSEGEQQEQQDGWGEDGDDDIYA